MQYRDIKPGQLFKIPDNLHNGNSHTGLKLQDQKAVNLVSNILMSISDQSKDFEIIDAFLDLRFKV